MKMSRKQVKEKARADRKLLDDSAIYNGDEVVEMVGGLKTKYITEVPVCGDYAYIANGNDRILIVWYVGDDWYQIIMEW